MKKKPEPLLATAAKAQPQSLPVTGPAPRLIIPFGTGIWTDPGTPQEKSLRFVSSANGVHMFEDTKNPKTFHHLSDEQVRDRKVRYVPGYYTRTETEARALAGTDNIALLPETDQAEIIRRLSWVRMIYQFCCVAKLPFTDATFQMIIDQKSDEIIETVKRETAKRRVGKKIEVDAIPCVRTLWIWWDLHEANGWSGLRPQYHLRPKPAGWRWHPEVEALLRKYVDFYCSEKRPTIAQAYDAFLVEMDEVGQRYEDAGMELLDYPSEKTFAKRIRKLGAFQIYASRWGIDKAWKKFQFVTLGLDVTAPGQRIEIDAWEIHLQALLIVAGVWDKLPKKLKKAIERGRLIICVAIDAASRAILGMAIARGAETAELGVRCLNMVVRDKKPFADAVGAFTPWNMCCPLHEIGVDQGVFTKDTFQRTVLALKGDVAHPAAGRAQDRARIERFFKTIDQRLMGFFTGRTFSNPVENGDYPNKARASITEEELYWVLVRYVVDVYHNTPHEGLNGETPYNAWHRLVREYGLKRLPDVDTLRNTFGVRMTRILSPKGVRFMNIFYHSTALHQIFTQYSRGKKVDIIVDTADLGAISVRIPNTDDWITVPAITRNIDLNGVSLEEWTTTCNALLARFGDQAKISEKIVLQTLREIIALSETAVKRAVIGATTLTPEQINSAERKLLIAWNSKQVGDANPEAGGDIFATAIPALPESGGTPQAAPHDDDAAPAAARDGDAANGDDEDADRATGDAIDPRDEEWGSDEWGFED